MNELGITRPETTVVSEEATARAYVDWAAIVAGTLVATAIFVVLTTFGSAVGLSLTSPYAGEGASATAIAVAIAIWSIWVLVSSLIAGGYLAGRFRHRTYDATEHESDVRDGAHGLLVWALAALLGSYLVTSAVVSAGKSETGRSGTTISALSQDRSQSAADTLLRSERATPGAYDEGLHREVATIIAPAALSGSLSPDDRSYLTRIVATRTGLAQADAERRVDATVADVRRAAEKARKLGVLVAFLTAASLAVGAAAAWWAAVQGGKHRDQGTDLSHLTRWS